MCTCFQQCRVVKLWRYVHIYLFIQLLLGTIDSVQKVDGAFDAVTYIDHLENLELIYFNF